MKTRYPITYAHQIAVDDQCYIDGKSFGSPKPFEIRSVEAYWTLGTCCLDMTGDRLFEVFLEDTDEKLASEITLDEAFHAAGEVLHQRSKSGFPDLTYRDRVKLHKGNTLTP